MLKFLFIVPLLSCSVVLQDGVRSAGNECSTSSFYWVADALTAVAWEVALSRGDDPNPALDHSPTVVLGASALLGLYKRHNCARYQAQVEENRVAVCSGGMRAIKKECFCAEGMRWNGLSCQGVPIADNCTGGSYPFGPAKQCFCLDGYRSDGAQCLQLECTGGAIARVDQCVCPDGMNWDGSQCVTPPPSEPDPEPAPVEASCDNGTIPSGDQCVCPDGAQWDGAQCSAPTPAQPQPRPVRTRREPRAPTPTPAPVVIIHSERPVPAAPPPAAKYHAVFQSAAGAATSCQAFDTGDVAAEMGACSRFCMGYLAQKLRCQCATGGC